MSREERAAVQADDAGSNVEASKVTPYTLKLPVDLHRQVKAHAVREGLTINEVIQKLLEDHLQGS